MNFLGPSFLALPFPPLQQKFCHCKAHGSKAPTLNGHDDRKMPISVQGIFGFDKPKDQGHMGDPVKKSMTIHSRGQLAQKEWAHVDLLTNETSTPTIGPPPSPHSVEECTGCWFKGMSHGCISEVSCVIFFFILLSQKPTLKTSFEVEVLLNFFVLSKTSLFGLFPRQ